MRRIFDTAILVLKGGVIGVANIIPGVSGGTLAVILGIYDRLIEAIARFFDRGADRRGYTVFLLKVFTGAGAAIVLLANLMDYLLTEHFLKTMFLFMGLILGGIPAVIASHGDMRVRTTRLLAFVVGALVVLGISILGNGSGGEGAPGGALPEEGAYLMVLIAGFLAGGAMIVPGVSGSFILVLLGQYAVIITAIKEMAVRPLACVTAGAAAGILVFSKVIELCLEKAPAHTYYFILGLIAASFYRIFPGVPLGWEQMLFCAAAFIAGAALSFGLSRFSE